MPNNGKYQFQRNVIGDYYIDPGKIIPENSLAFDNIGRVIAKKIFRKFF